jgi:hypothetical protein
MNTFIEEGYALMLDWSAVEVKCLFYRCHRSRTQNRRRERAERAGKLWDDDDGRCRRWWRSGGSGGVLGEGIESGGDIPTVLYC